MVANQICWNGPRIKLFCNFNGMELEATSGIEPEYTVLQTVA